MGQDSARCEFNQLFYYKQATVCVCGVLSRLCGDSSADDEMWPSRYRHSLLVGVPLHNCSGSGGGKESPTLRDKYLQWLQSGGTLDMSLFDLLRSMGFKCRVA